MTEEAARLCLGTCTYIRRVRYYVCNAYAHSEKRAGQVSTASRVFPRALGREKKRGFLTHTVHEIQYCVASSPVPIYDKEPLHHHIIDNCALQELLRNVYMQCMQLKLKVTRIDFRGECDLKRDGARLAY